MMTAHPSPPPPPLQPPPPPLLPKGFYKISGEENLRCRLESSVPKSPAPILPSWISLRGALGAMEPLCKTKIPSSDVNSLEGRKRVIVERVSWCIWALIYMSTKRRGGISHKLGTLKTLNQLHELGGNRQMLQINWGRRRGGIKEWHGRKLLQACEQTLSAAAEANFQSHIKRENREI